MGFVAAIECTVAVEGSMEIRKIEENA